MTTDRTAKRQREIARRLTLGERVPDVALELGMKVHTIHKLLSDLYDETGTRSQAGLAGWCVANGIVTVQELQEVYGHGDMGAQAER